MNNTALRAKAQSANNTHMVFTNEEYGKFDRVVFDFYIGEMPYVDNYEIDTMRALDG